MNSVTQMVDFVSQIMHFVSQFSEGDRVRLTNDRDVVGVVQCDSASAGEVVGVVQVILHSK